jgi:glycosyltransferase involved in cell wall biosynthesis
VAGRGPDPSDEEEPPVPTRQSPYSWVVVNQTQAPAHQQMLERLAGELGPGLLFTGTPHPAARGASPGALHVEKGPSYERRDTRRRLATWGAFVAAAGVRLARLPGRPFVLVMTNPPLLPHLAWALGRLRGLPYGLLVWDIYPEHLVEMGWVGPRHPVVAAWRALNRLALRRAEVVITLSDAMAETLRGQLGGGRAAGRALEVIPSWADADAIGPLGKGENPFAWAHGQVGRVTVMYSGNMGATHGLESLVEAARALRDDDRVRFLLVGDGNGRAAVAERVARHGLENVRLLPYQPWDVLPRSLAVADIAVVAQAPGTEHLSLPSKTYTSLAAGSARLALTSGGSDLARLVHSEEVGVVCARDDPAAVAAALRGLLDAPERLARYRANARRAAVERYSADAVFERLLAVLSPHVGAGRSAEAGADAAPRRSR